MTLLFTILIVLVCILLTLVVLVQNPKGGGLGSAFGGAANPQMFGGVKKTTDFLDRSTWTLAIALFVLVLGINMVNVGGNETEEENSEMTEQIDDAGPIVPATPASSPISEDELPESVDE
jgi:preprotein translocase subunit SecG